MLLINLCKNKGIYQRIHRIKNIFYMNSPTFQEFFIPLQLVGESCPCKKRQNRPLRHSETGKRKNNI